MSASQGFIITGIIELVSILTFCQSIGKWPMIAVHVILLVVNFTTYNSGKLETIVKDEPLFFRNRKISVVITMIFFLTSIAWLFFGAVLGKHLLENC